MNKIAIQISVLEKNIPYPINYVQGTNAIPIELVMTDYTIPSSSEVRIYIRKPSGKEIYNDCTYSGNTITIQPTLQMFAETGGQEGQIQIVNGGNILVSFILRFNIERNIIDSSAIESSNEYTALDGILTGANETMQKAREATQSATNAAKAANTAATNAQTVANTVQRKLDNGELNGPKGDPGSIENIASQPVSFTQAAAAANIKSGDTVATLFGKLLKFQVDAGLNTENINKVVNWLAARNKTLWEGNWAVGSTGTISVPDWDKYSLFLITNSDISTGVMAREGNRIAGLSGYSYNGSSIIAATNFIVTGNAWKMDQDIVKSVHTSGGNHGAKNTSIAITKIVGLEPIPEKI